MSLKSYMAARVKKQLRFAVLRPPEAQQQRIRAWLAMRKIPRDGTPAPPEVTREFNELINDATADFILVGFIKAKSGSRVYDQHGYPVPGAKLEIGDVFDHMDVFLNRVEAGFYKFQPQGNADGQRAPENAEHL